MKAITLLAKDAVGDQLRYTVVTGPIHGVLVGTPPDLRYTPAANYSGPDSFTFKANDGSLDSNKATVSISVTPLNDAPTGTVTINGGAATTNSTLATLTLTAVDDGGGAIQMCLSNTSTCSTWTPFAAKKSWALAAGNGTRTVNVWFRDQGGNTSVKPYSDTIFLDTTAPTNGTVTVTPGDTQLTLNWSGFADTAGSGISGYQAFFQESGVPASCSGTTVPGYAGKATTLLHTALVSGTTYGYRVCATDAAGNRSTGATVTAQLVSINCAECHNGNPDYPLAPNVMTYWGGSVAGQDGGHGDLGGFAAVACTACHDVNLPSGPTTARHGTGVYNSIWANDSTRSTNTAHLKAEFFTKYPAGGAGGDWSIQVAMDNYCTWECHDPNKNDVMDSGEPAKSMRHESDTLPGADDHHSVKFGTHLTPSLADPNPDLILDIPIDVDLNTDASPTGNYAPCVSCHDPHGTSTLVPPRYSSNRMLRFRFPPDNAVLCSKCHR